MKSEEIRKIFARGENQPSLFTIHYSLFIIFFGGVKKMKTILKAIMNWILLLLTGRGPIADEAVDEGICDFSGQGRDLYGN